MIPDLVGAGYQTTLQQMICLALGPVYPLANRLGAPINFKSPPPDSLAFEANGLLILKTPYATHSQTLPRVNERSHKAQFFGAALDA